MDENQKIILAVVVVIALTVLLITWYYFFMRPEPDIATEPEVVPAQETAPLIDDAPEAAGPEPLGVALDDSDPVIRELAQSLSSHEMLLTWLTGDDFVRRFVAAVDNIANGLSPRAQIDFFSTDRDFPVILRGGHYYLDPEGYRRYDIVADVFAGIDTDGFTELYRRSGPQIREAYTELGYPDFDFHMTLKRAFVELLKVPAVEEDILLIKKLYTYRIADSKWEKLSDAQKHLLRMGPDNVRLIQEKLRDLAAALRIPPDQLPEAGFKP
jgi:hypothetical protein